MSATPEVAKLPCQMHKVHSPKNLTVEWRHILPVSWQLSTILTGAPPFPGRDPEGRGMLWDERGVWLCPTGHRNVHLLFVQMMSEIERSKGTAAQAWASLAPDRNRAMASSQSASVRVVLGTRRAGRPPKGSGAGSTMPASSPRPERGG